MKFKDVKINEIFFENKTGEFHLKLSDKETVVVGEDGKQYYKCEFRPNHPVEKIEKDLS